MFKHIINYYKETDHLKGMSSEDDLHETEIMNSSRNKGRYRNIHL